jgi:2-keto-4-pentenoate hydratase
MQNDFMAALIAARQHQTIVRNVPDGAKPADLAQGYLAQAELNRRLREQGLGPTTGHKIGCTTPVMQEYLGIPHPCYGEVFASRTYVTPAVLQHRDFIRPGVECEIAVTLGSDMPAIAQDYDQDSAAKHVLSCHAAIEVVDDRYENFETLGVAALVADDFFNAAEVLGPAVTDWEAMDLTAIKGEMWVKDVSVGVGHGAMILGHPMTALAWLANEMNQRGTPLKAGSFISLGSVVKTVWIDEPGTTVEVTFEGLGTASVEFV